MLSLGTWELLDFELHLIIAKTIRHTIDAKKKMAVTKTKMVNSVEYEDMFFKKECGVVKAVYRAD